MFIDYLDTPLGLFEFMATEQGIRQAIFCGEQMSGDIKAKSKTNDITALCKQQLIEYFSGQRQAFTVPLDSQGTASIGMGLFSKNTFWNGEILR